MKPLYILAFLSFIFYQADAQRTGILKGQIIDKVSTKPIALSTVTIFDAKDTSIITYRLTNDRGEFIVPDLPFGKTLRVILTHIGFKNIRKDFSLTAEKPDLSFGIISMVRDTALLPEILVKSETPPVIVRNDTIEFNASSFKTLPNALVEDLLKKLPGVIVDREGDITYNGKKVTKIFVDGREFFGSDPKIASRNLPSNIIDKIQVTDDKDTKYLNPNAQEWEIAQIINLKLKKEIKSGWFGKVFAGYGTNDQYDIGAIVNSFRDTLQLSFIGFANNINRSGFSSRDLINIGGFSRSGFNNMNGNGAGGLNIDGISFGGGLTGKNSSAGIGSNINTIIGKKTAFNIQYFFGDENQVINKQQLVEQNIKDTLLHTTNLSNSIVKSSSHLLSFSFRNNYTPASSLSFKPSISFIKGTSDAFINLSVDNNKSGSTSSGNNYENILKDRWEYSHDLIYSNNKVKKTGRVIRLSNNMIMDNGVTNQYNNSNTIYYSSSPLNLTSNQLRRNDAPYFLSKTNFTYIEPISKKVRFSFAEGLDNFSDEQEIVSFNKNSTTSDYDLKIDSISGIFKRTGFKSQASSTITWVASNTFGVSFGLNWQWLNIQNKFLSNSDVNQNYQFFSPAFRIQLRKNVLSYSAKRTEPQSVDIQPLPNYTNPLFITQGNLNLKPTTIHTISFTTGQYDGRKPLTYNVGFTYNIYQDAIIRERTVNNFGVQSTYPINANGNSSLSIYGGMGDRIKLDKDWILILRVLNTSNYIRNVFIVNSRRGIGETFSNTPSIEFNFNWKDKIEFYPKYSFMSNKTMYENSTYNGLSYLTHRIENGIVLRLIDHVVFEGSVDYQYNTLVAQGIKRNITIVNAAINYVFLKDDKGVLKLSGFDLLNENTGVSRLITENYIQTTQVQLIRQYFLMTFTYNIRKFGTKNVGGKEGLFRL